MSNSKRDTGAEETAEAEETVAEETVAEETVAEETVKEDTVKQEIGEFIRQQRVRADLSLRRLANRAGISNPYLSQIERGIRKPSAEILKRLSRALEVSAESLYSRAGLIDERPSAPSVIEAINADRALSPRQQQVLLDLYRALLEASHATAENTRADGKETK